MLLCIFYLNKVFVILPLYPNHTRKCKSYDRNLRKTAKDSKDVVRINIKLNPTLPYM